MHTLTILCWAKYLLEGSKNLNELWKKNAEKYLHFALFCQQGDYLKERGWMDNDNVSVKCSPDIAATRLAKKVTAFRPIQYLNDNSTAAEGSCPPELNWKLRLKTTPVPEPLISTKVQNGWSDTWKS